MKVLLVQSMEYLYPWGGAHKANRILMEGLADRGHECRVITPSLGIVGYEDFLAEKIRNNDFEILEDQPDELFVIRRKGVKAYTVKRMFQVFPFIKKIIDEFNPDITIVSEDNTHLLLETVLETQTRTVFFAHSQATLPSVRNAFKKITPRLSCIRSLMASSPSVST